MWFDGTEHSLMAEHKESSWLLFPGDKIVFTLYALLSWDFQVLSATHGITGFSSSKVCFHCREPGHGVADCPAVLESQDMGTGICYRCGSTEHDLSKCRAKVDPAAGESQEFVLL